MMKIIIYSCVFFIVSMSFGFAQNESQFSPFIEFIPTVYSSDWDFDLRIDEQSDFLNLYHEISETGIDYSLSATMNRLTPELLQFYKMVIFIDAAPMGNSAQTMTVYSYDSVENQFDLLLWDQLYWENRNESPQFSWLVSTGMAGYDNGISTLPGFFNLHQDRHLRGHQIAGMIDSLFIDLYYRSGRRSGIALHGTPQNNYPRLGRVASHGCVRMHQRNSRLLFDYIHDSKNKMKGLVPVFYETGDSKNPYVVRGNYNFVGQFQYENDGSIRTQIGYQVLLVVFHGEIENIPQPKPL